MLDHAHTLMHNLQVHAHAHPRTCTNTQAHTHMQAVTAKCLLSKEDSRQAYIYHTLQPLNDTTTSSSLLCYYSDRSSCACRAQPSSTSLNRILADHPFAHPSATCSRTAQSSPPLCISQQPTPLHLTAAHTLLHLTAAHAPLQLTHLCCAGPVHHLALLLRTVPQHKHTPRYDVHLGQAERTHAYA